MSDSITKIIPAAPHSHIAPQTLQEAIRYLRANIPADHEKMPNLQTLRIENLIVDDFSFLPKCKNLKILSLYNTNFTDCRMLPELPKLKEVNLHFCPLEHEDALQSLDIRRL